ncbi:malto-oligosyltrehalose synthase [Salmonella enterica subsp. enterica serovar Bareilly]
MIPTATYRLQFRNGMTFDRAAALVPYLKNLGISHLYASPIFTATKASTHGYDVTDANEIEPSIGGREGFERLVAELKAQGLGLIIDIVPNHMASSLENAWWRDVLEYGKESRYARHFDIDWSRRLTLPFLGDTFDAVLENGEIAIKPDPATGKPTFAYYDNYYPLAPATWQGREAEILALTDKAAIADLHERQPWKLMSWREAARSLSYRRFFEVTGLVGMRVEDKTVFDDTHRLILELVRTGAVDGLRIDHIDGLADPKAYLARLRQEVGPACYITVEKILAKGEQLPDDWPVSGTTGYEFIASLAEVLVDDEQIDNLRQAYETVKGAPVDMRAELRAAKLLMVDRNFEGEFTRLLALALSIASELQIAQEESVVRQALRELLIAFPVYRTYGTAEGLPPTDICLLHRIVERVKTLENPPQPEALTFLSRLLTGDVPTSSQEEATQFRVRFQQLTGPLMAKSVEDTLFFRQNMGLALNEVGAEPDNRREPDFATLAQQLDQLTPGVFSREESWLNGQVNQYVTAALLRLRQQNHELFRFGDYIPLRAVGQRADKVIAYARVNHDDALIVVAPRLVFAECDGLLSQSHSGFWSGTDIIIPGQLNQHRYRNVLTQERLMPGERLSLASHQGGVLVLMSD